MRLSDQALVIFAKSAKVVIVTLTAKQGEKMPSAGIIAGFILCWLVFGAIVGAVGIENRYHERPIIKFFMYVALLPWLVIGFIVYCVFRILE